MYIYICVCVCPLYICMFDDECAMKVKTQVFPPCGPSVVAGLRCPFQ